MSKVDTVRILIPDLDITDYLFTDEQIEALLEYEVGNVNLVLASLLEAIATNDALTYKYVRTDDLTVDGSKGVLAIMARANRLRDDEERGRFDGFTVVYPLKNLDNTEYVPWA